MIHYERSLVKRSSVVMKKALGKVSARTLGERKEGKVMAWMLNVCWWTWLTT
jgi:hypothetical protein